MPTQNYKDTILLSCTPQTAYDAWMDSDTHSAMLGVAETKIENHEGGKFKVWDGEASGNTLKLNPKKLTIEQSWRYDYEDWQESEMSTIKLEFYPYAGGTKCKLYFEQTGIPEQYAKDIIKGWEDFYWRPMQKYFNAQN